jgi:hypothetical protein
MAKYKVDFTIQNILDNMPKIITIESIWGDFMCVIDITTTRDLTTAEINAFTTKYPFAKVTKTA